MKTAQQGRGDGAPAEQTAAPMGAGLALPLWSKPDIWAFFRWPHDRHIDRAFVGQADWRCVRVCTHVCTSAHATRRVFLYRPHWACRGTTAVLPHGQLKNVLGQGLVNCSPRVKSTRCLPLHSSRAEWFLHFQMFGKKKKSS